MLHIYQHIPNISSVLSCITINWTA